MLTSPPTNAETRAEKPAFVLPAAELTAELPPGVYLPVPLTEATEDRLPNISATPWDVTGEERLAPLPQPRAERPADVALARLQEARVVLLRKAFDGGDLSTEDAARYAQATGRLERLYPRVTTEDFERMASMAEEIDALGRRMDEAWSSFGSPERRRSSDGQGKPR